MSRSELQRRADRLEVKLTSFTRQVMRVEKEAKTQKQGACKVCGEEPLPELKGPPVSSPEADRYSEILKPYGPQVRAQLQPCPACGRYNSDAYSTALLSLLTDEELSEASQILRGFRDQFRKLRSDETE